jgi:hypothetical protein
MKRIFIDELTDIADIMYENINDGCELVTFIGLHEDAQNVVKNLLNYDDSTISLVTIELNYDKEYFVTLDKDMHIYCEKAYQVEYDKYLYIGSDCVLIADDCNSAILKNIESKNVYEVSFDSEEDGFDTEMNYKSESSHVSRTKDGKIAGFTKSWSNTDKNGVSCYSSYSHYSSDEELVKTIARNFGIDI